jgi:hypothetical protein
MKAFLNKQFKLVVHSLANVVRTFVEKRLPQGGTIMVKIKHFTGDKYTYLNLQEECERAVSKFFYTYADDWNITFPKRSALIDAVVTEQCGIEAKVYCVLRAVRKKVVKDAQSWQTILQIIAYTDTASTDTEEVQDNDKEST